MGQGSCSIVSGSPDTSRWNYLIEEVSLYRGESHLWWYFHCSTPDGSTKLLTYCNMVILRRAWLMQIVINIMPTIGHPLIVGRILNNL